MIPFDKNPFFKDADAVLRWATEMPIRGTPKDVLISLACKGLSDGCGNYLTAATLTDIVKRCGKNRKTVVKAYKYLRENGYIWDTGSRMGKTRRIIIYRFVGDPKERAQIKAKFDALGTHKAAREALRDKEGVQAQVQADLVLGLFSVLSLGYAGRQRHLRIKQEKRGKRKSEREDGSLES